MDFRILYEDENYMGIYKPHNIPVHRSAFHNKGPFVLQELRNQTGKKIYPVHRLDHAASGLMLFGLSPESASILCSMIRDHGILKKYLIMVRGFIPDSGIIDSPFSDSSGRKKNARTFFRKIASTEIDIPTGRYRTSRYSLADVQTETGRRHQIRRHFARISHPVIGDSTYGDLRHNHRIFETAGFRRLMLFSYLIMFRCPVSNRTIKVSCEPDRDIMTFFEIVGWKNTVKEIINDFGYIRSEINFS